MRFGKRFTRTIRICGARENEMVLLLVLLCGERMKQCAVSSTGGVSREGNDEEGSEVVIGGEILRSERSGRNVDERKGAKQ